MARIAAANDPVDALVLVAGDLPLDDWRELASDEVIALNLHGPIHFARAYLPARHDGAPAWRMVLVRSLARRIGGLIASPLRHREGQRLDRARGQTGHSKSAMAERSRRRSPLRLADGLEWPVQMWNHDAGAVSGGSKHRTAVLRWVSSWTSAVRVAGRLLGGSPTLAILDALAVEGETTQVLLPAFGSSQPARETIVEANARSRPNGPCGRPRG